MTKTQSKQIMKAMKEKSFKETAIAQIKQAVNDVKKGVFLF